MSSITTGNAEQYGDSRKLAARARLHTHYTIAETGWFEWVAEQLPLKPKDKVLDCGCGPAWFWSSVPEFLPEGLDLTVSDLSPGMVREALQRCAHLPLGARHGRQADAQALPFETESFDAVIAMHMVYHLADQAKGIAEMFRVLKPGGFLAVTTNGSGNLRELYALTAAFGSPEADPSSVVFGYEQAEKLLEGQFGNVAISEHPASVRITEPEDVFLALTSYPPGEDASDEQLTAFREAIDKAFARGGGVLESKKEMGLFISRKTA